MLVELDLNNTLNVEFLIGDMHHPINQVRIRAQNAHGAEAVYDDVAWHQCDNLPMGIAAKAAGTHSAMLMVWLILRGLTRRDWAAIHRYEIIHLRAKKITPADFYFSVCEGQLAKRMFSSTANAFLQDYYEPVIAQYFTDYNNVFSESVDDLFFVEDSWQNFRKVERVIDATFRAWCVDNAKHTKRKVFNVV